jgi:predicted MFS family arabinose efflux permease
MKRDMPEAAKTVPITPGPLSQGFIYPGSMMAVFAVSPPDDQAVVTTTMMLWRNLGIVVGVALSSLVLQNDLLGNLKEYVNGPEAEKLLRLLGTV